MNASLQAVANVARVLKPGMGRVLVRDYAEGDLAQLRLSGPTRKQRLSHNFYVRSDGTQAYYFSKVSLPAAWCFLCCIRQAVTGIQSIRLGSVCVQSGLTRLSVGRRARTEELLSTVLKHTCVASMSCTCKLTSCLQEGVCVAE